MQNIRSSPSARRPRARGRAALRLAVLALIVGVLLGLLVPRLFAAGGDSHTSAPRVHVVSSGETLWSIAAEYGDGQDPREFVSDLRMLNGLRGASIFPGQKLTLP